MPNKTNVDMILIAFSDSLTNKVMGEWGKHRLIVASCWNWVRRLALVINWELVVMEFVNAGSSLEKIRAGHAAACPCQASPYIWWRSVGSWHTVASRSVFFVWEYFRSIFKLTERLKMGWKLQHHRAPALCLSHTRAQTHTRRQTQTHTVPLKWRPVQ